MPDFIEEVFLKLACKTPLPRSSTASFKTKASLTTRPYTRAQAKIDRTAGIPPECPPQLPTSSKKRSRKPEFGIFDDADPASPPPPASSKKLKPNARIPLSDKTDGPNLSLAPSLRYPDVPFRFSSLDPLWENAENYDCRTFYMTPPSTPGIFSPTTSPSPRPSPNHPSTHPPTHAVRPRHNQRTSSPKPIPPPKDMTLYTALHLDTWRATTEEIKMAHHKFAREHHPDKVLQSQREEATHLMQTANAAAEVLLDSKRRRAYHKSGRLPWTT